MLLANHCVAREGESQWVNPEIQMSPQQFRRQVTFDMTEYKPERGGLPGGFKPIPGHRQWDRLSYFTSTGDRFAMPPIDPPLAKALL